MKTLHAYGVVLFDQPRPDVGPGVGGAPVEALDLTDDLAVLVSRLPGDLADPAVWEEHAADLPWLSEVAQAHHAVLQEATLTGDVVPLRLPGLYVGEAELRRSFTARIDGLTAAMERVRGRWEWAAKAFEVEAADDAGAEPVAASTGREYLGRRIAERRARESSAKRLRAALSEVVDRLASAAVDVVHNAPQDPALSGRSEPMLLNVALLAERGESASLVAVADECVARCAEDGLLLEVNGPWPPYNFSVVEA